MLLLLRYHADKRIFLVKDFNDTNSVKFQMLYEPDV